MGLWTHLRDGFNRIVDRKFDALNRAAGRHLPEVNQPNERDYIMCFSQELDW